MGSWRLLVDFEGITDQDIAEIVEHEDENGTIVEQVHSDHSDAARRAILRLYTLETPLYRTLNKANSCRDERAIPTLGPYATVLYYAIRNPPEDNKDKMKTEANETIRKY